MSRLHEFLTTPCPKAVGTVQCEIERVRVRSSSNKKNGLRQSAKGVRGRLFPTRLPSRRDVDAHYQSANRQNEAAQLKPGETSGLVVSRHATREVGRLQGNFIGTEFQIFVPPRDAVQNNDEGAGGVLSALENGAITYTANLLGNRPRIMDVCLPKLREDGTDHLGNLNDHARADDDAASVDHDAPDSPRRGLLVLQNRPPWWNVELGAFVLNFGGRVKVASVKNFQLCERNDRDHVMQFGRIEGRHAFTMDFGHPLTPVQAFAIAISSLQSKISFG
ncbi:hypothetical protein ACHAWF_015146 [Thalassiosira exigua]